MKHRMLLLVVFTIVGISCDPLNPIGFTVNEDYFPLSAGDMWEYSSHVVGEGVDTTLPMTVLLGSPFTFDGVSWYGANDFCVAKTTSSALPLFCASWAVSKNQVLFTVNGPGPVRLEHQVLLDFPLWFGKSWLTKPSVDTSYVVAGGDFIVMKSLSRRTYWGRSTVLATAGLFLSCLEVTDTTYDRYEYHPSAGGPGTVYTSSTRTTEWYAKDVGLVKQILEWYPTPGLTPGRTETRLLTKYSLKGL